MPGINSLYSCIVSLVSRLQVLSTTTGKKPVIGAIGICSFCISWEGIIFLSAIMHYVDDLVSPMLQSMEDSIK